MIKITIPMPPVTKKNSMRIVRNRKTGKQRPIEEPVIVSHDGSRVLYDKDNPRTEVYIADYE